MNKLSIWSKSVYLARGAAEAVARWADAVTQLAGFVICCAGALPIRTQFWVAFALSFQKLDQLAVVDACCLTHLKCNDHINNPSIPLFDVLFHLAQASGMIIHRDNLGWTLLEPPGESRKDEGQFFFCVAQAIILVCRFLPFLINSSSFQSMCPHHCPHLLCTALLEWVVTLLIGHSLVPVISWQAKWLW